MDDDRPTRRDEHGPAVRADDETEQLARGSLVGRYVVLDVLGQGGMGIVYAAYDPELDRKVAIKLLQASDSGTAGSEQAWLLREAQAMARLAHPNVIAVHDVGSLSGSRVFVAMELVDGITLREWLRARKRSWREVVEVMRAAGSGLAAAHAADLVHRDFKPENVLVGRDGRVRVMDFGLARLRTDDPDARPTDDSIEMRSPLAAGLTVVGSVVGTPAYLAPEIRKGQPADARTDQFAFGVALYEALYGQRPFKASELANTAQPLPKPKPLSSEVPARIERAALRAMAGDPAARFPTMDAVTAELAIDPGAFRRRVAIGVGVAALLGAAAIGVTMMMTRGEEPCSGVDKRLAGVWDAGVKRKVHDAFVATKLPLAERIFASVSGVLDKHSGEWRDAVTESCRSTRIRKDQTEEVFSLRQDCFEQRLEELRAYTSALATADAAVVERAHSASNLESIRRCADIAALRAPGQPPPENRVKVAQAIAQLSGAKAGLLTTKIGKAINNAQSAAELAKAIPWAPLEAEARLTLGLALHYIGNTTDAEAAFSEASWLAFRTRRDDVLAQAALSQALLLSQDPERNREANVWLQLGGAAAARGKYDVYELRRLEVEGAIATNANDRARAIKAHEQALALAIRALGRDNPLVANDEQLLAATLLKSGDPAAALPHYQRALALLESSVGPEHTDLGPVLTGMATCFHYAGDRAKAKQLFERSLALQERVFGSDSINLVPVLNNTAEFLRDLGDTTTAMPMIERAQKITEATVGRNHPFWHNVATTRAELLAIAGKLADARALYDDVLQIEEKAHSSYLPYTLMARGRLALAERKWPEAASFAERSIAAYEAASGSEAPELWKPLSVLATAKVQLGKPAEARPLLERALAIADKAKLRPADREPLQAALAALPTKSSQSNLR